MFVNLKQAYFILSLKKIRIWLESKTPLELKLELKKFTILKWTYSFLIILSIIFLALFILDSANMIFNKKDSSIFQLLNGAFILLMSLLNVSFFLLQLRFFVTKKLNQVSSFDSSQKFALTWVLIMMFLFTLFPFLMIVNIIIM